MDINLLDIAKGYFSKGAVGALAAALGEKEDATNKAIGGVLPSILGGLMSKSSTSSGASALFNMLDDADDGILDDVAGLFTGDKLEATKSAGGGMLSSILGNNLGSVAGMIAKMSGLGKGSSSSLLSLVAPIVMGLLRKTKREHGLDAGGLASLLQGQSKYVKDAAPAGLFDSLGLGALGGAAGKAADVVTGTAGKAADVAGSAVRGTGNAVKGAAGSVASTTTAAASSGGSLIKKLLPLLLLALAALFGWKMCGSDITDTAGGVVDGVGDVAGSVVDGAGDVVGGVADAAGDVVDGAGDMVEGAADAVAGMFDYASGATAEALGLAEGSVGANFIDYLKSGSADEQAFTLDRVKFETGSATLTADSRDQLDAVKNILDNYGAVHVQLQGHTDPTGNADANMILSQNRAESVMNYLVGAGIDGSRLTAKGYGSTMQKATNAESRRTDMIVTKR